MPLPTHGQVHIDAALTNISTAYLQDATNFVAGRVFPTVPVDHKSDKYFTYTKGDFRRNNAKPRAAGTESAGGGFRMSTDNYSCETYALHKDVPDDIRNNADPAVNVDADATRFVTEQLLIQKEVQWASDYFTTGVWATDVVGTTNFTKWDDASSDPETDIDTGKAALLKLGKIPNTLVVGYSVHQALKKHPLIVERYKHTTAESITADMIAAFLEIDRYIVAMASYNTAAEGATDVDAMILGDHALLCYVAPSPGLLQVSSGYTFVWRNANGGLNSSGMAVSSFRMQHLKSDRVEGEFTYDHKVVASDLGYFFSAAVG